MSNLYDELLLSTLSLTYNHALSFGIVINDLVHFFKVDGAAFVDVDGEETLFVLVFVPFIVRVGRSHQLLAEASALIHVQISVSIIISL